MLHFFNVEGLLVRRWVPGQRRIALEVWTGDGWVVYADVDNVSRHGERLTYEEALALLQTTRGRQDHLPPFSDAEADTALSSRQRRG